MSLAAKLAPSPDWIVGVSALELCNANCTWTRSATLPLYPYDAGTDSGLSYTVYISIMICITHYCIFICNCTINIFWLFRSGTPSADDSACAGTCTTSGLAARSALAILQPGRRNAAFCSSPTHTTAFIREELRTYRLKFKSYVAKKEKTQVKMLLIISRNASPKSRLGSPYPRPAAVRARRRRGGSGARAA